MKCREQNRKETNKAYYGILVRTTRFVENWEFMTCSPIFQDLYSLKGVMKRKEKKRKNEDEETIVLVVKGKRKNKRKLQEHKQRLHVMLWDPDSGEAPF